MSGPVCACGGSRRYMGLGSIRPALEDSSLINEFMVRNLAPDVLLLSNIGAEQVTTYGANSIIEMSNRLVVDAIAVHFSVVSRVNGLPLTSWYQMKRKKTAQ